MFTELPKELQVELLSFIDPPSWETAIREMFSWLQKKSRLSKAELHFEVNNSWSRGASPNLSETLEVICTAKATPELEFGKTYKLEFFFEHWEANEVWETEIFEPFLVDITEKATDLLRWCPRQITKLPKLFVTPKYWRQGRSMNILYGGMGDLRSWDVQQNCCGAEEYLDFLGF